MAGSEFKPRQSNSYLIPKTLHRKALFEREFIHLLREPITTARRFPKFSQGFLQKMDRKAFSFSFPHLALYALFYFLFFYFSLCFFSIIVWKGLPGETSQHCHLCLVIARRSLQRIKPTQVTLHNQTQLHPRGPREAGLR